jgi:serine phosphatase RsbU (regulator of sigma subunit)
MQLTQGALEAAVFQKEIGACKMIQQAIVRLDSAGHCYDLGAEFHPSRSVGGDWASSYFDKDGRAALYIADVTGHGLDSAFAASVIAGVINTLHAAADGLPDIVTVMKTLADISREVIPKSRSFTFLAIRLDPLQERLTVLNCGHSNPLILDSSGKRMTIEHGFNDLVTSLDATSINVIECPFSAGSSLIIWTDGLLENAAHAGRKLRTSWLLKEFSASSADRTGSHKFAQEVATAIFSSASKGVPEEADADDVCLVVVRAQQQFKSAS